MKTIIRGTLAASVVLATNLAYADGAYVTATLGRSEYPLKAFEQSTVDNTESNHPMGLGFSMGYKHNKWIAAELGYVDFGQVTTYGRYAAERRDANGNFYLDYSSTNMVSGEGFARGYTASLLMYPLRRAFVRVGTIQSKSKWTITAKPRQEPSTGEWVPNGPHWDVEYRHTMPLYGVGITNKDDTMRVEWMGSSIQPHGDSAFGDVGMFAVTFKF